MKSTEAQIEGLATWQVELGKHFAANGDWLSDYMLYLNRKGAPWHGLDEPEKFEVWRSFYWNHRKIKRAFIELGLEACGMLGGDTDYAKADTWQLMYQALRNVKEKRGLEYITVIWIPCRVEFGETPSQLYYKAIHGDFTALCNLLRIDKTMILDKRIARRFAMARLAGGGRWRKLNTAYGARVRKRSKRQIKTMIAALLHDLAQEWHRGTTRLAEKFPSLDLKATTVTTLHVRAIFDAHAQETTGAIHDADLPEGDEAFYAAIRENSGRFMPACVKP